MAQMEWESDQQLLEMEKEEDLDREEELAAEEFSAFEPDDSQDDGINEPDNDSPEPIFASTEQEWPWYKDQPYEVQEPEIIECPISF
jgi:hypothetical protein